MALSKYGKKIDVHFFFNKKINNKNVHYILPIEFDLYTVKLTTNN